MNELHLEAVYACGNWITATKMAKAIKRPFRLVLPRDYKLTDIPFTLLFANYADEVVTRRKGTADVYLKKRNPDVLY